MRDATIPDAPDAPRRRIESIDVVRGVIMVIMALDHTRDFFGNAAASPTNMATTTAALFLTRWVTHICAPVFFLLTGMGAYLVRRRRTTPELARYLLTRGLWLVFLDMVIFRFLLQFNMDYHVTILTVLWALGWSMVVLAALVYLPPKAVAAFGIVMIVGHNLLDPISAPAFGALAPLWTVLHAGGVLMVPPGLVGYLLMLLFAVTLGILPVSGAGTPRHLVLPALTLALGSAASITRLLRANLLDELGEDYVRTARAKGLSGFGALTRHALRNALNPVVTVSALRFGRLLGEAVIVETIFAWPGIGRWMVESIYDRDYPAIQGFVLYIATVFLVINLAVDLSYRFLDPRVRLGAAAAGAGAR